MFKNPQVEALVEKRYREMIENGETEGPANIEAFGKLSLYINIEPTSSISEFTFGSDIVYLGSSNFKNTV